MNKEVFNISFKGGTLEDILNSQDLDGTIAITFGEFFIEHLKYYNPEYSYNPSFSIAWFNSNNRNITIIDADTTKNFKELLIADKFSTPKRLNFFTTCIVSFICSFEFRQKLIDLDLKNVSISFKADERYYRAVKDDILGLTRYIKQRTDINKTILTSKLILKQDDNLTITKAIDITTGDTLQEDYI